MWQSCPNGDCFAQMGFKDIGWKVSPTFIKVKVNLRMSVLTSDKNPPGWWRERKFRRMLNLLWELLTSIISVSMYIHLLVNELLYYELKAHHLNINKVVLKNCKRQFINLCMAWIDQGIKRSTTLVSSQCLRMFGIGPDGPF